MPKYGCLGCNTSYKVSWDDGTVDGKTSVFTDIKNFKVFKDFVA